MTVTATQHGMQPICSAPQTADAGVRRIADMEFPDYADAPRKLLATDGHCGLLAAWTVLRHFGKRVSAARLIKACRYTRRHGVFTIGLATALAEHGLSVQSHSNRDPRPTPLERRLYRRARELGVPILPATSLRRLAASFARRSVPIVFWDTATGVGHSSPLLGVRRGRSACPFAASAEQHVGLQGA